MRIAIENCPMVFERSRWPGGTNLAYCPAAWDAMFDAIPSPALGLNLDPSHLVWLQVDYERAVQDYGDRIFHVAREGHGDPTRRAVPALDPLARASAGRRGGCRAAARSTGSRFVGALRDVGYDGAISVEHEDEDFEGSDELVERGFLVARDHLRPLL